jgi:hypothetical protein
MVVLVEVAPPVVVGAGAEVEVEVPSAPPKVQEAVASSAANATGIARFAPCFTEVPPYRRTKPMVGGPPGLVLAFGRAAGGV